MATFRRILHPSDFSPASRGPSSWRRRVGGTLLIAHVLPNLPLLPDAYIAATTYDEMLRGQRAAAKKQLDRLVAQARKSGARASGLLLDRRTGGNAI